MVLTGEMKAESWPVAAFFECQEFHSSNGVDAEAPH